MQGFRSSINLQFDLSNPQLLDRYVLTASHSEVLRGILGGVVQGENHAHLLIGPYGTGKSLLSTIVCQMLSRRFANSWRDRLVTQAERIDTQLAAHMRGADVMPITYIPVIINGKTGSLRTIVNQAIYRALHQANIPIVTPNEASTIINTVGRWKKAYPDTYAVFMKFLSGKNVSEAEWRVQIESCQEVPIRDFAAFYPSVTAGTPWLIEHETYFMDNLEALANELSARQMGLFIVYDEFGRFLQSLGGTDTLRNMQDLQDFAEFVNRTDNMHLLLVGHKHIRQYAVSNRENVRSEFEKVEKRFRFYSLETDAATFLRLAQEAITETAAQFQHRVGRAGQRETVEMLQRFPLFSDFTAYQLEYSIIEPLYPLHPVAVQLLPHLSNIFGQNERTLFSFLSDDERYSLRDHAYQYDKYYYADQLFDFFGVDMAEHGDQPSLQLYHTIAPYLEGQTPLQRRIVRLLTLWTVTRLTQKQPMTTAFLAFALGVSHNELSVTLEGMLKGKILRYNTIRDHWELYDGSSIDLNAVVAELFGSATLNVRDAIDLLERHLPFSYIWPYEYNDEMDMLRYADIRFATPAQLKNYGDSEQTSDDRLWLVLYEDTDQMEEPAVFMNEIRQPLMAGFPFFTMESVRSSLLHYKIIEQLLHDPAFLALDARVKNELSFMLQETSLRIQSFVDQYFHFDELCWCSGSERKIIRDLQGLERLVTIRLRNKYPNTPCIRNESFNRHRISSIQRRALIDVIDRILHQPGELNLGITGYGPNYLIYATALKNNGYTLDVDGHVQCNGELANIKEALVQKLNERPIGPLSELIGIMEAPPFGVRSAVVPLLFVALLRDRWDQLLIYSNDMLITHLTGSSVLEIIELAERYEYRYYNWTTEEKNQLLVLGQQFELPSEVCASFLYTADALLQWLRRLPKFAQITRQVSTQAQEIRDAIRAAEVDPYQHMKRLAGYRNALAAAKEELEQFMACNSIELERQVLGVTRQRSFAEMFELLKALRPEAIGKNCKLLTLAEPESPEEMIDHLAEHLVGVTRAEWSDSTQDLFLRQIEYEWQLLHTGGEVAVALNLDVTPTVPLSKKSQTLYANVKNMLKYAGKDVPKQEVRQLLIKLLQEI